MADRCRAYDGDDEAQLRAWIADVLEKELDGESFHECLQSGVVLCELLKKLAPQQITGKISRLKAPFPMRENIKLFLDSLRNINGFREQYLFTTEDLFEGKDMKQVVICLLTLARLAHDFDEYRGPLLGQGENHGITTQVKHSVQSDSLWGKVGGSYG